ncbi:Dihydropteroate synthase [Fomitiporia mediterranea MF3/22]|uniref:Dihydropteroate synthase n=1 Tax=Fomitiporia mediterranea (strain MF3/22) TaxID=694068 RepID=UPI0004408C04|nr:Dihydropteroate synthase [Fomitiporia mediterranea MF3/22]EJD01775.1 Dihydropteroate synthase [Fomitiporia mediterranea MF3/22]
MNQTDQTIMDDHIRVRGLMFHCSILGSPWPSVNVESPARTQPITVSVDIQHDIQAAAQSDDVSLSIDYSKVSKNVEKACGLLGVDGPVSDTPYDLTERILEFVLRDLEHPTRQIDVDLELPKMVLRAKGAGVKLSWRPGEERKKRHSFFIIELPVHAIVGIRSYEREYKQPVVVNIEFDDARQGRRNLKFDFAELEYRISEFIEASAYGTIEALGQELARRCFVWLKDPASFKVTVRLEKPAAVISAQAPEIKITRTSSDFPLLTAELYEQTTGKIFAALALGANLGDRFQNIELAIRYLEDSRSLPLEDLPVGELEVVSTSFLYESPPQYLEEQPAFINCACLVETTLSPCDLLRVCKHIERTVGRVPSERFGPRAIDIDIVTYGDYTFDSRAPGDRASLDNLEGHLVIPHPRMKDREFVLRPLKDIIPEWVHPLFHRSVRSLLAQLMSEGESSTLVKVLPFPISQDLHPSAGCKGPATLTYWTLPDLIPNMSSQFRKNRLRKTYIMATLNVTPDSFSDGGENKTLETALAYAKRAVDAGADIIDIGGYSTRPGALSIPASEEIDRVVPVIQAIRSSNVASLRAIPISIDTFRVNVAKAALSAGANLINDVYAFNGGPEYPSSNTSTMSHFIEMRKLAHDASVPVVMMHSRGDAGQNKDYSDYKAAGFKRSVLEGVRAELGRKILRATEGAGALRRWQVIADPGIGFSKDLDGNLCLLRNASSLIADISLAPMTSSFNTHPDSIPKSPYTTSNWNPLAGFPLLVGASRKSFLGTLLLRNHVLAHDDARAGNDLSDGSGSRVKGEERPARERDFATAAAVTCAVGQGTSVVRVHAVEEMIDVVQVATALYYES